MNGFNVDKVKTLNAAVFILNQLGETDYHKVFKILYFADQNHLKKYGRPITGDTYQAMNFGPVPSFLYDLFKAAEKGIHPFAEAMELSSSFTVRRAGNIPCVSATIVADADELSESNLEVIIASITEHKGLNFEELVKKSHDKAWDDAAKLTETEMSYLDIAAVAGTSEEMMQYIALNAENDQKLS
jgi:uncharacterized phage-associated protein